MAAGTEAEAANVPPLPQASSPEVEAVAALGTPLSPESADVALDGDGGGCAYNGRRRSGV